MSNYIKWLAIIFVVGLLAAATPTNTGTNINKAMCSIVNTVKAVIPSIVFLLVIAAALVYGVGQLLSAEMRSRASVWASSMIVGAIIAILILILVPPIMDALLAGTGITVSTACNNTTTML
ncbi:MAG: hypothetical protein QW035_04240 [Candidatus Anstonellales archaeon]